MKPDTFAPELIAKIKTVQLKAGHLVTDMLSGNYESAFRGQGIEFSEVREYIPGDDIRSIDWKVTARMNVPFIKEFHEERELTILILIDLSSSQNFGTVDNIKKDIATELSAVLSYLALKNNDKIGLIAFKNSRFITIFPFLTTPNYIVDRISTVYPYNEGVRRRNSIYSTVLSDMQKELRISPYSPLSDRVCLELNEEENLYQPGIKFCYV